MASKAKKGKSRSAKKRVSRKKASKKKKPIPEEKYFFLIDGSALKSIEELADALDKMSEDMFYYHANDLKNDFARWVRDVFSEAELAKELEEARSIERAQIALLKHLIRELKQNG